jgi:hypothetical protein
MFGHWLVYRSFYFSYLHPRKRKEKKRKEKRKKEEGWKKLHHM